MRLGPPGSRSYVNYHQRLRQRNKVATERLCTRLDRLVARAERFKKGQTRAGLLEMAEKVRGKLRVLDH